MRNTVRVDWAIKRLLRNKANFGILEGFLSELLGEDVKIDSLLKSESNKQSIDYKMNRVDLLVLDSKGELIIIEVQSNYSHDYPARILFGVSKLLVDHMDKSMAYSRIRKVISVNIVYFDLGHGTDYIYHGSTTFVGLHTNDTLNLSSQEQIVFQAEEIQQIYPEYYIIKVNNFDDVARNTLDEWINFLKNEEVSEDTKAKGLKEAKEKLDILKLSREEMQEYESDLDAWRDYASSVSTSFLSGKLEGEANRQEYTEEKVKEKEMEMALKCLKKGMHPEVISDLTGLSEDEISNNSI